MTRRQRVRLISLLPVWGALVFVAFFPSTAEDCVAERVWDKKEQSYVYYFTCEVAPEVTATPTEPVVDPSPSPSTESPSASAEPTPTLLPTEPAPTPSPDNSDLTPLPAPSDTVIDTSIPEETYVTLGNGVTVTVTTAEHIELLKSPAQLLATSLKNPVEAIKALGAVGVDMKPETRKKAQKVVISAIIVVQVVGGAVQLALRSVV